MLKFVYTQSSYFLKRKIQAGKITLNNVS